MIHKRHEPKILPPPALKSTVVLTVDVEDYFMSPEWISFEAWESYPSRIHLGMERCLNFLDQYQAKATFFFVGWLAERYPELVKWTREQGHEIGTHTYTHTYIPQHTETSFQQSLSRSLEILQEITPNQTIIGHRAPAFSLKQKDKWAFRILKEQGILYDTSINPHSTYLYGEYGAPRHPYLLWDLAEIPPSTLSVGNITLPVGGGGTLRIFPELYLQWARKRYAKEGYPPVIYIHPWEFVPDHPALSLPLKQHLIHWIGIKTMQEKLRAILEHYQSICMKDYYNHLLLQSTRPNCTP